MIPNHPQFVQAAADRSKVGAENYSAPGSGVVVRSCAPIVHGLGNTLPAGANRYSAPTRVPPPASPMPQPLPVST